MKKFISIVLVIMVVLCMSITAFAKVDSVTLTSPKDDKISAVSKDLAIRGTAPKNSFVEIYLNDVLLEEIEVGSSKAFASIGEFVEGKNTIKITAKTSDDKSIEITKEVTFTLKSIDVNVVDETAINTETTEKSEKKVNKFVKFIKNIFTGD